MIILMLLRIKNSAFTVLIFSIVSSTNKGKLFMYPTLKSSQITKHLVTASLIYLSLGYASYATAATTSGLTDLRTPLLVTHAYKIVSPSPIKPYFAPSGTPLVPYFPYTSEHDQDDNANTGAPSATADVVEIGAPFPGFAAQAYSDDSGVYYSGAQSAGGDIITGKTNGAMSFSYWSQTFVKDTADAQFKFIISDAFVKTTAKEFGHTIAEFRAEVSASKYALGAPNFWEFDQYAALEGIGYPTAPVQNLTTNGPMTYTVLTPDQYTKEVDFSPYTGIIDLSNIDIGEEFQVYMTSRALAMGGGDTLQADAYAYFRDPINLTGGFQIEASGLTATNNVPAVPLPAAFWLFLSGVGVLLARSQKTTGLLVRTPEP